MALGSGIRNQASGVKMFFLRNFFYTFKKKKILNFTSGTRNKMVQNEIIL